MSASTHADSVRDRIVSAAKAEFSQHGIAGARIDRIAKAAKTSKERVYAYFSSKVALYRFVSAKELAAVAEATRMDPTDLPGYAGRLYDYFTDHPDRFRLMSWGQLELDAGDSLPHDTFRESVTGKIEQIREAQEAGQLDAHWDPVDILVLVHQIATAWAAQPDLLPPSGDDRAPFLVARRTAIVAAVERLFPATVN
ncbi:TetR family transcriptional regulator [Streptomyces sp. MBT56]|uniref:TetR family transcriptional regulator n=1 Tax=unclassified Streptomyces TaxID=2593676 RepID=UPI00190B1028|nr:MULTISPECIES: TetR family transcriptional regulator [unclassified Streptomyces]MBK3556776.1 TetR family transcriptional regulator [Streptomyces sp. MBT56]MBK3582201.1 TetR family transcriptional regulator [Streptomyces sp. MBT57]MBK3604546.1 TetR family transcriptional regulator [Streptomyces sp. MBT54]MBK3616926.1 TetR family transcriptional regulator [Streptomyces sp. MBT98]